MSIIVSYNDVDFEVVVPVGASTAAVLEMVVLQLGDGALDDYVMYSDAPEGEVKFTADCVAVPVRLYVSDRYAIIPAAHPLARVLSPYRIKEFGRDGFMVRARSLRLTLAYMEYELARATQRAAAAVDVK